jgi:hypothetical protein
MKELLISQIAQILATVIVAILVVIIKKVGDAAIELLVAKKKEAEIRIIASGHEAELNTAKEVWNIIEEKFRITENATQILGSKSDLFDKLLLGRIPGLSQQNLDDLRQAIAGEVNKCKDSVTVKSVANTDDTTCPEKIINTDTTASSKITVDNPDNEQSVGTIVNATSAVRPN